MIKVDRALTFHQALLCEAAKDTARCRCRCAGTLHGTRRSQLMEYFEQLPELDPHRVPKKSRQLPLPRPLGA